MLDKQEVLTMLNKLLEQAEEVEAASGQTPTAQEALEWAVSEIEALTDHPG